MKSNLLFLTGYLKWSFKKRMEILTWILVFVPLLPGLLPLLLGQHHIQVSSAFLVKNYRHYFVLTLLKILQKVEKIQMRHQLSSEVTVLVQT